MTQTLNPEAERRKQKRCRLRGVHSSMSVLHLRIFDFDLTPLILIAKI